MPAGGHSDRLRTDGPGTANIQGGIPYHPDVSRRTWRRSRCHSQILQSGSGHVIAIFVFVAEAAAGEIVPQPEMLEFSLRSLADVAREQAQEHSRRGG
ncbi:MAG: hypothetical protein KatS3mg106_078 [Gemmataceae bacterium]|nr:MAG: hypothetical protein KatS3mg106_078 [Gemmataceae bacterium]